MLRGKQVKVGVNMGKAENTPKRFKTGFAFLYNKNTMFKMIKMHTIVLFCFHHLRKCLKYKICSNVHRFYILYLSYDVAYGSKITACNKIDKPLGVYRFKGNV